jgi:hypothetical protein
MPVRNEVRRLDRAWRSANRPFELNGTGRPAEGPAFEVSQGARPLVFAAVHAVAHQRGSEVRKRKEANTGGLALALSSYLGGSSAVVYRSDGQLDANRAQEHPLKDALEGLVGPGVVLVDLHGMSDVHGLDFVVGRGPKPESSAQIGDLLVDCLRARGFDVDADGAVTGFTARDPGTMTAWAQGHGAVAVQLEIAHRNRSFPTDEDRRLRFLDALTTFGQQVR